MSRSVFHKETIFNIGWKPKLNNLITKSKICSYLRELIRLNNHFLELSHKINKTDILKFFEISTEFLSLF
ncbi:hypothetical protein BpHYR1_044641 [Brachionus plicatilis]|uniref:Uncharacterized protein n=1 Tax=Brachionus plicatilis TaxID=10195 RepID=A0A3M7Q906_BRAPC|nr:hypothetical protein BpHYR1_044641 [Brachionus plicatilis]